MMTIITLTVTVITTIMIKVMNMITAMIPPARG
jgi:hypothetical protein